MAMTDVERYRPREVWDPFTDFQDEMNRVFGRFLGRTPSRRIPGDGFFSPALDLYDTASEMVAKVELPGVRREDVEVTVVGDMLNIKGSARRESEVKDENYHRAERIFGSFQRTITLPLPVDPKNVKATFKDGILEIRIPKAEEVKPKQVKID